MKPGLQVDDLLGDFDEEEAVAVAEPVEEKSFTSETFSPTDNNTEKKSITEAEVPATSVFKNKTHQDKKERQFIYSLDPHRCRAWQYNHLTRNNLCRDCTLAKILAT